VTGMVTGRKMDWMTGPEDRSADRTGGRW
jgi:hypothetical protein